MMAKKLFPLVICLFVLLPGLGNSFELEGYGGFYRYDGSLADEFKADSSPIFGVRFGSGARQLISGETTIGYGPAEDIRIILLMGNFLINVPVDLVVPYFTLGTGTTIYLPDDLENTKGLVLDTEVKFTLNYGGGFRYFLNDLLSVRFDMRDYVTFDLDFDAEDAATGQSTGIGIGTIHNMVIGGGLSLSF
jgi:hypothetical protein